MKFENEMRRSTRLNREISENFEFLELDCPKKSSQKPKVEKPLGPAISNPDILKLDIDTEDTKQIKVVVLEAIIYFAFVIPFIFIILQV